MMCSLIIPTYNEAGNISRLINELFSVLKQTKLRCEIFVVDDSSDDRTAECVSAIKNPNVHLLKRSHKMGIGSAYRYAFPKTSGDLIVIMDADFSHDPSALKSMLEAHDKSDSMIVFSSRYITGGEIVGWGTFRRTVSLVANGIARFILRLPNTDVTSSYRVYSREIFRKICEKSIADGFAFQVEAAFWCKKYSKKTQEIPIVFRDRTAGASKFNIHEILSFLLIICHYVIILLKNRFN